MNLQGQTISLVVKGEIDLDTFAAAVDGFKQLAKSLANDLAPHAGIKWQLEGLQYASATISLRAVSQSEAANRLVAHTYRQIGEALEYDRPLRYPDGISNSARRLARLTNRAGVSAVQLATRDYTATVTELGRSIDLPVQPLVSLGSVNGLVESLSRRGDLHLILIDDVFSGRVSLHLQQGQEELGRSVWDQRVTVSGRVTEEPGTGRPTDVRSITSIEPQRAFDPGAWRSARGAFPWQPGDPPAEQQIREIRGRA